MWKLRFWVACKGWKAGGYENGHYFTTKNEAKSWLREQQDVKEIELTKVSKEHFRKDVILY